jgi:ParB-like chromosome segregation protein Spo0J
MLVEERPIESICPYENNPRINDPGVDAVAASIREFGFRQLIVVDEDGVIIVGHTRYKAAVKLGLTTVRVHVAVGLSPAQANMYRIADNQIVEESPMGRRKNHRADHQLLTALACGATQETAARQAGVSVSTARRRLADPEFCRELQALVGEMVQRTARALTAAGAEAVRGLLSLLKETTPPAVRLGAIRAVLELGVKLRETADLEARIAALEEHAAGGSLGG